MTTAPVCPQCGTRLEHNEVGAWCPGYPCRYAIRRRKLERDDAIARAIWPRRRK